MKDLGKVRSVSEAVQMLSADAFISFHHHEVTDYTHETIYKFPFGIWFRGHQDAEWKLRPWIFRETFDECSMFHHFQIRAADHREAHRSVFDWLCLMQHYQLPTRLLDWSESVLVALYFAALGSHETDGKVYILNARRLNFLTNSRKWQDGQRAYVCTPWSLDVVARAQLVVSRSSKHWVQRMSSLSDMESWRTSKCREVASMPLDSEALARPVGVLPSRLNGRMIFQSSAFTLHGGKQYLKREGSGDFLPEPVTLEEIDAERDDPATQFLQYFVVPGEAKSSVLRELLLVGIHPGALFPEVDRQAESIRSFWNLGQTRSTLGTSIEQPGSP